MNEWMIAAIVVVGSVLAIGAGGWLKGVFASKPVKKDDAPKA